MKNIERGTIKYLVILIIAVALCGMVLYPLFDLVYYKVIREFSNMIKQILSPKMGEVTTLVTDCKSSYESEANINGWNLIQIKSSVYTDGNGNSLSNINSLHSGLSSFLACFKGVSTKHLQGYLDWYIFDKYLNYCFEEDKQFKEIFKNGVIRTTIIREKNAYENYSGIDFFNTYADYNFVPSV